MSVRSNLFLLSTRVDPSIYIYTNIYICECVCLLVLTQNIILVSIVYLYICHKICRYYSVSNIIFYRLQYITTFQQIEDRILHYLQISTPCDMKYLY